MDEMIWAFEQTIDENGDKNSDGVLDNRFWKEYVYDRDAHLAHMQRVDNGILLFGKYYQGLWD